MRLTDILRFIWHHPLNKGQQVKGLTRFFRWQIGSRILGAPIVWPYVNDARLLISRGMASATGNLYVGLLCYEEMAFLLHYLRSSDVFFDIGANVGTYTILASKAVGAKCVAIEPDVQNFSALMDNIYLNRVADRVRAVNIAAGGEKGRIRFCSGMSAISHIQTENEHKSKDIYCDIDMLPLDHIAGELRADVLKIDVEGYETEVLRGGAGMMAHPDMNVLIIELIGHGAKYGFDERAIDKKIRSLGFAACEYDPAIRTIIPKNDNILGDMLYIRDINKACERVTVAPQYEVGGKLL